MINDAEKQKTTHEVSLVGRERMEIHGVTDVQSFDEQLVSLNTICGNMEINGSSLHIHVLSMEKGIVALDGHIDSVTYFDASTENRGNGFFSKLFH